MKSEVVQAAETQREKDEEEESEEEEEVIKKRNPDTDARNPRFE